MLPVRRLHSLDRENLENVARTPVAKTVGMATKLDQLTETDLAAVTGGIETAIIVSALPRGQAYGQIWNGNPYGYFYHVAPHERRIGRGRAYQGY